MFVNFDTPNPAEVISNELRGKTYSKVYIKKMHQNTSRYFTRLDQVCDKLTITFRGHLSCDRDIDVHIAVLVIVRIDDWFDIPRGLLNGADYIMTTHPKIPDELLPKIKLSIYRNDTKHQLKPDSRYNAKMVSDFEGVNFGLVSKLWLTVDYENMMDMMQYLAFHDYLVFKEVIVSYRHESPRSSAPFFDLSLLAGIKTRKLSLNNSKYTGFWKLVSLTAIPYISWRTAVNASNYRDTIMSISEELQLDEEVDISENYTLLKFLPILPYRLHYSKVLELCERNKRFDYEKRFARTHAGVHAAES